MTRPAPPKVGLDDVTVAGARAEDLDTFEREDVTATAPPPGSLRALLLEAAQTDLGNAERFVAACRDLVRFDVPRQTWLCWDGTRWRPDDTGRTMRYAKRVMRRVAILALDQRDTKLLRHAVASESRRRLLDCLALAGTEQAVVVTPDQLDADALWRTPRSPRPAHGPVVSGPAKGRSRTQGVQVPKIGSRTWERRRPRA